MAANGAVVRLPVELASTCAKTEPSTAIQIGSAVADAVEAFTRAMAEESIPMRPETRTLNGEKLAVVVELWLDHREVDDFRSLALRAGCSALLERHAVGMRQLLGADVPDAAMVRTFDQLCACVVSTAGQVAAVEAVYRSN